MASADTCVNKPQFVDVWTVPPLSSRLVRRRTVTLKRRDVSDVRGEACWTWTLSTPLGGPNDIPSVSAGHVTRLSYLFCALTWPFQDSVSSRDPPCPGQTELSLSLPLTGAFIYRSADRRLSLDGRLRTVSTRRRITADYRSLISPIACLSHQTRNRTEI